MTLPPIKPIQSITMPKPFTQSQTGNDAQKQEKDNINIEWYCNGCHNYFKVPDPVKYKYDAERGELCRCKVLNCPFCGSEQIINNRNVKSEESLWTKII